MEDALLMIGSNWWVLVLHICLCIRGFWGEGGCLLDDFLMLWSLNAWKLRWVTWCCCRQGSFAFTWLTARADTGVLLKGTTHFVNTKKRKTSNICTVMDKNEQALNSYFSTMGLPSVNRQKRWYISMCCYWIYKNTAPDTCGSNWLCCCRLQAPSMAFSRWFWTMHCNGTGRVALGMGDMLDNKSVFVTLLAANAAQGVPAKTALLHNLTTDRLVGAKDEGYRMTRGGVGTSWLQQSCLDTH